MCVCVWYACARVVISHKKILLHQDWMNKRMYTVIILPVQVSFSLTNPDLHSVQFPAPGPEHVCLQDKWQAGKERGGRRIKLVSGHFKTTRITS